MYNCFYYRPKCSRMSTWTRESRIARLTFHPVEELFADPHCQIATIQDDGRWLSWGEGIFKKLSPTGSWSYVKYYFFLSMIKRNKEMLMQIHSPNHPGKWSMGFFLPQPFMLSIPTSWAKRPMNSCALKFVAVDSFGVQDAAPSRIITLCF